MSAGKYWFDRTDHLLESVQPAEYEGNATRQGYMGGRWVGMGRIRGRGEREDGHRL